MGLGLGLGLGLVGCGLGLGLGLVGCGLGLGLGLGLVGCGLGLGLGLVGLWPRNIPELYNYASERSKMSSVTLFVLSKLSNKIAFYNKQNIREFKKYSVYIMIVNKTKYGYSSRKKHITGKSFVESLSNVFNSIKSSASPDFKSIGNYVVENKDLIAKPLLGAVGSLAVTGLAAGVPAILTHIANKNRKKIMQQLSCKLCNKMLLVKI